MLPVQQYKNNTLGMTNQFNPYDPYQNNPLAKWGSTSWQQSGLSRMFQEQQEQKQRIPAPPNLFYGYGPTSSHVRKESREEHKKHIKKHQKQKQRVKYYF